MSYQSDGIRVPATGKPECLLTWISRPEGGIRLFASRRLHNSGWGQASNPEQTEVAWHFDVTMTQTLIVDRETPAEAIQWVLQRWTREDAEESAERLRVERLRQHAIAGQVVSDPKAITNIGGGTIL